MADDCVNRIERLLGRHGISTYRFEVRRRHRAVVVDYLGREVTVVFPASGSDWRGPHNAVSNLRHALRLVGRPAP